MSLRYPICLTGVEFIADIVYIVGQQSRLCRERHDGHQSESQNPRDEARLHPPRRLRRDRRVRGAREEVPHRRRRPDHLPALPPVARRLRPAPGRQPDDAHQAALPAASPRTRWTPWPRSPRSTPASHRGHITTRENFQFHFVNLDDTAEVMRILGAAGLTTREACAHTVRNITGCPYAGISPRRGLRHHALPRGLRAQHAAQPDLPAPAAQVQDLVLQLRRATAPARNFHDLGFIAKSKQRTARVRGFEMRVGGGTSTMPRHGRHGLGVRPTSTTASTSASPRPSCASSTARATCPASCARTSTRRASSSSCTRSAPRPSTSQGRRRAGEGLGQGAATTWRR